MNFYKNKHLKFIFVCFGGKWNFLFFIFLTSISALFDLLILVLASVYIMRQLSIYGDFPKPEIFSTSSQFPIDTFLENFVILIIIRFLMIFFRIYYEYRLRIKFIQHIRNQNFILNSKLDVYSKIIKSPIADFTSRVSSWQLGANGMFNALTSIFSSFIVLVIAPLWILKIADFNLIIIIFFVFLFAALLVSFLKYFSLRSYRVAVSTDVESTDKCLYLFNDWRFLKSVSDTNVLIKKTKFLFELYSKEMAQSEVFIVLIRPLLELLLILSISIFIMLNAYGVGLELEQSLQIGLISLRLVPAVSGIIVGYTGIANNLVYYDHIIKFDKFVENKQELNTNNIASFNIFKVDNFSIVVNQPIQVTFAMNKKNKNSKILNITGKSGAGKSIVCDIISGQLNWSGQIIFKDNKIDVNNQCTNLVNAVYLTQITKLHRQPLVDYLGPKKNWIKIPVIQKILQLFKFVNLLEDTDYIGTDDRSLSGGQTQIIRLVKALKTIEMNEKVRKTIIIDEGLSGIPFKIRSKVLEILINHRYEVIYISHDINDIITKSKKLSPNS